VEQAYSKVHLPSILHGAPVGDECYDELEHVYRLQAMSTYTYSLRMGGKLFLRAHPIAVIEWHVHHILDEVVNCCST
jgi:hypothetical protein